MLCYIKAKILTKSKRKDLVTSINEVDINILCEEVISHLQQDFKDSPTFKEFANLLCREKEPLHEIVEYHRSSIVKFVSRRSPVHHPAIWCAKVALHFHWKNGISLQKYQ